MSSEARSAASTYSLAEIRENIERQDFEAVPDEAILALCDVAEAAEDHVEARYFGTRERLETALGRITFHD